MSLFTSSSLVWTPVGESSLLMVCLRLCTVGNLGRIRAFLLHLLLQQLFACLTWFTDTEVTLGAWNGRKAWLQIASLELCYLLWAPADATVLLVWRRVLSGKQHPALKTRGDLWHSTEIRWIPFETRHTVRGLVWWCYLLLATITVAYQCEKALQN